METSLPKTEWKDRLLIKGGIIGLLALVLEIPALFVEGLIRDRESRQREAITEVSSKWAGRQNLIGPLLVVPYYENISIPSAAKHYAYFLPESLHVQARLQPQEKNRGIYKVMLYSSQMNLSGSFGKIDPQILGINPANMLWNEASLQLNLGDVRGLNEELRIRWNGDTLVSLAPGAADGSATGENLFARIPVTSPEALTGARFSASVDLNGTEQLLFTPTGSSTTVELRSSWPDPSFTGNVLPQLTEVKDSGFRAVWKSLPHKRNFPAQWKDADFRLARASNEVNTAGAYLDQSAFGVNLLIPVNAYQKTTRSVKYALLCILLTFASFFLIELANRRSVHPFQYGLIGCALVLFYLLLLSFAEYIGFNASYLVAAVCTVGLIAWFVQGILGSGRLTTLLTLVLTLIYTYVFTILQLQDYSLLLGSLGLFLSLAVIMRFSKKFQW